MAEPSEPRPSRAQGPAVAPKTLESLFQAEKISMSKEKEHMFTHLSANFDKKRLFVCCDGTQKNASGPAAPLTNVGKLSWAVSRFGRDPFSLPLLPEGQLDSATHDGAPQNADNWYGVLDEIILVGSSHGAHTVRGLAKFLNDVGLLRGKGLAFLQPLYQLWKRNAGYKPGGFGNQDDPLPKTWVELDSMCKTLRESGTLFPVKIKVLAEWDPVSAGIGKGDLGFVRDIVPGNVKHAFLAYALHEKRAQFKPMLWAGMESYTTRVKLCAFNGTHADIAGGSSDCGLSTFALLWMVSQIQAVCKAAFDSDTLLEFVTPLQVEQKWWERGFGQWRIHDLLYTQCLWYPSLRLPEMMLLIR
ncbi:hypothetical protein PG993_000206 [Apiospora rasikravindrae]|uniref:T6SS Phospholipase effector Tle1-like catalytic domain-containing protein n=1 Tax=Apiospora rasikravindrae TaxID=990691 RepID=A0ABR1UAN6_9PEZI